MGILIVAILAGMAFLQENIRIIAASLDPEESLGARWNSC